MGKPGFNQGIFYPEYDLPRAVARFAPSEAVRSRPTTGKLKCLVLLVDFSDNQGSRPASDFQDMLFSQGTHPTGSLRDFYKENSYGQLDVDGQVIGWLRLPQLYSFYVNGDNGGGSYPNNAQKMVEDALNLAAQQVDFRQFDTDGDNFLDGLFVVHAGDGAEADPNPTSRAKKIWSHQWDISQPFVSNGITAYAYCTEPEDGRAGVFCHEFGHMLGLPDLYDTTYASGAVGAWCVMGSGSWNNAGLTPGHFCAWSKATLGWVAPKVMKKAATRKLKAVEREKKQIYRLWSKGKLGTEYFLIENRQRVGFDAFLPADGLLVWHIDDSQHNNDHPGSYWVGLRQADGLLDLENNRNDGDAGDPFPGTLNKLRIDGTTTPNSNDRLGSPTSVAVTNIAMSNKVVSCRVKV
jgi:immune inhibitor A